MRASALLLVLPAIVAAQQQKPLLENVQEQAQAWLDIAKSYLPEAVKAPVSTGAAKAASKNVTPLTKDNWDTVLSPSISKASKGPETWMVMVSGGNKTCIGGCEAIEKAWNESAALFAVDPTAPNLAHINCDVEAILCSTWLANAPSIWHIQLPVTQADQSRPATTIRIISLNATTTTSQEIVQIHTEKTYEKTPVYEGAFHPFDGWVAKAMLNKPIGYVLHAFSIIPSWAFMILISMGSRTIMYVRELSESRINCLHPTIGAVESATATRLLEMRQPNDQRLLEVLLRQMSDFGDNIPLHFSRTV